MYSVDRRQRQMWIRDRMFGGSDSRADCRLGIPAVHLLARRTLSPEAEHFGDWHVVVRRDIPLPLSGI